MDDLGHWLDEDYDRAYRTACLIVRNRADAEEAVQEAFLRAWRFRDALPDGDARRPWLYRVLVNACYSHLRREVPRRERAAGDAALAHLAADGPGPEAAAAASDTARVVGIALAALPEHLRVPVVLRFWTGLTEREIALVIRRRPGTVKSRLHEARRRLAEDPSLGSLMTEEGAG